jgi:hypothetical protein
VILLAETGLRPFQQIPSRGSFGLPAKGVAFARQHAP